MDAAHVNSFQRTILDFRIHEVEGCGWGGRQLYELYIRGTAFLWHQVSRRGSHSAAQRSAAQHSTVTWPWLRLVALHGGHALP